MKAIQHLILRAVCFCLFAAIIAILGPRANAWMKYEDAGKDVSSEIQSPPVEEHIMVGGFAFWLDRTQLGATIFDQPQGSILGVMMGKEIYITISTVPAWPNTSLEDIATSTATSKDALLSIRRIKQGKKMTAIKAAYGQLGNPLGAQVRVLRYYFASSGGDAICLVATSRAVSPDWDYVDYLTSYVHPSK